MYLFPNSSSLYVVHATPSFHGAAAHPDFIPGYVPSVESQIIVLKTRSSISPVILVIDVVIFSEKALHSEISVKIPWSDWGPKYTHYFLHRPSYRISMFGSKMAYALPQDRILKPEERPEGLSAEGCFYVHIFDFNKRAISRSANICEPDSLDLLVRKSGELTPVRYSGISNHPYIVPVCRGNFHSLFLE
ncbi:hypothetical protein DFH29DRAFT_964084 [Suillus ampliporus]|nr:hypothetical protein DFH29DRAFT_964084 [Suillus ampliporus]